MKAIDCLIQEKFKIHTIEYKKIHKKINELYEGELTENDIEAIKYQVKQQKCPCGLNSQDRLDEYIPYGAVHSENNTHSHLSFQGEIGDVPYKKLKLKICEERGYLFLTGLVNEFIVIDLDIYKKNSIWELEKNNHPFIRYFVKKFNLKLKKNWYNTLTDIIKSFKTYVVKSPSGGFHIYMSIEDIYNKKFKECEEDDFIDFTGGQSEALQLDIQGDNALIMGEGSEIKYFDYKTNEISNRKYECYIDSDLNELDIEDWGFLLSLLNKSNTEKKIQINKISNRKLDNDKYFKFDSILLPQEVDIIFKSIQEKHIMGYENFKIAMALFKAIGEPYTHNSRVDKLCKKFDKYDFDKNLEIYNYTYPSCKLLDKMDLSLYKCRVQYKPTMKNIIPPTQILDNVSKIAEFLELDPNKNYFIKSGTGTGKTYLVISYKYGKWGMYPIISITSRVSLAGEHKRVFESFRLDSEGNELLNELGEPLYEEIDFELYSDYEGKFDNTWIGKNILICIDSIIRFEINDKCSSFDFSNYTVILDEVNSIIKYLYTSSTLNKTRDRVKYMLKYILKNCRQVIGMDADITDTCLFYMNPEYFKLEGYSEDMIQKYKSFSPCVKDIQYIHNTRQHFKDTEFEEIQEYNSLLGKLFNLDKFMVCCDSADKCNDIKKKLTTMGFTKEITVIDRRWTKKIDLDIYDCVIFSPKIIYGLDSQLIREVYSCWTGHTITFEAFLQQLARNRNPIKVWLYFETRKIQNHFTSLNNVVEELLFNKNLQTDIVSEYKDYVLTLVKEEIYKNNELSFTEKEDLVQDCYVGKIKHNFEFMNKITKTHIEFDINILSRMIYDDDCGNSNKYLHTIMELQNRGFKFINNPVEKCSKTECEGLEVYEEDFIEELNTNTTTYEDTDIVKFNKLLYENKNEILKLNIQEAEIFGEYFYKPRYIEFHLAFCALYLTDRRKLTDKYITELKRNVSIVGDCKWIEKVIFIKQIQEEINCIDNSLYGTKKLSEKNAKLYLKTLTKLKRSRKSNPIDLTDKYELAQELHSLIKSIIKINKLYTKKQNKHNNKTEYSLDTNCEFYIENCKLYNTRISKYSEQQDLKNKYMYMI